MKNWEIINAWQNGDEIESCEQNGFWKLDPNPKWNFDKYWYRVKRSAATPIKKPTSIFDAAI